MPVLEVGGSAITVDANASAGNPLNFSAYSAAQDVLFYGGSLVITGLPNTIHTVKVSGTTHLDGAYSLVQLMSADLAKGSWTQSNPMQTAKGSAVSVKLDARRYLLCGGSAGSSDVKFASCETYDMLTDTWAGVASMNAARDGFTMTKLADGRVLAVGGTGAGGGDSNRLISCEIYDPVANTWTYTGDLVEKAFSHAAVLMGNGKVLVVGGRGYPWCESHRTSQLYDPATGKWSQTGDMNYPRQHINADNSLVKLPNGKIMVLGGVRIDKWCDAHSPVPPPELYDPETGTWSPGPPMAVNRIYPTISVMPDSKVLVCGGNDNGTYINTCEVYDPATNAFTTAGVLSNAKDGAAAALLSGNSVMVAGGSDAASLFSSVDICDASGCVPAPPMNTARNWFKLLSKADGTVVATGGYIDSRVWTVTNASETYQASGVSPTPYTLFLSKAGSGTGSIAPDTGNIVWSSNAGTASYAANTAVTLTATPNNDSMFAGWSGACTGTGNCQVTMDAAKSVTAAFDLAPVNGACGTASGQSFAAAPTTNLCASGTVSALPTGSGPWSWSCNGSNGGTSENCSAVTKALINVNTIIGKTNLSYEGSDLTVGDGITPVVLTINGSHYFSNIIIKDKAIVTHSASDSATTYSMELYIKGALTLDSGAKIDVSGQGYLGGQQGSNNNTRAKTTGNSNTNGSNSGSGGSYGGMGGSGLYGEGAGITYGSAENPVEPGAGGGGMYSNPNDKGGNGGGLVRIYDMGLLTNNGRIIADGNAGEFQYGGGGAGGGVYINARSFSGTGVISTNGGNGRLGDGGGGRIAIISPVNNYSGQVYALGGKSPSSNAQSGTVYYASDVTPPDAVTALTATPSNGSVALNWINPTDSDFAGVRIVRKTGVFPTAPWDGKLIYVGTGTTFTDTSELLNGNAYYFSVYSFDNVQNYSVGVQVATQLPQANNAPVAHVEAFVTNVNAKISGFLNASYADGDSLAYTVVANPSNGLVVVNHATGEFAYTPQQGFFGTDAFTFKANDGQADSVSATITITVNGIIDEGFESGGFSALPWNRYGSGQWIVQTDSHSGNYAARAFANWGGSASLEVKLFITSPGNLSFWYKAKPDIYGDDYLVFLIDGVEVGRWKEVYEWTQFTHNNITAGMHTFTWVRSKGGADTNKDDDYVWLDDIMFPPFSLNPINGICGTASGQSYPTAPTTNLCSSGTVSAIPSGPGPWSWSCNGSNGGTSSPLCSASVSQSITITTPAPASAAFNSQFTVSATASSGLPVIYSSGSPDVCNNNNDGAIFTLIAPTGSCIVRYDQPGNGSFSAAPQLTSDTIALKADQSIGVISLNPATLAVGGTATVSATGGLSGNPVTFSSTTTNVCTVSGSTVSGVAAGQCTIAADQAGNANYNAAQQATQTISVGKGNQAINGSCGSANGQSFPSAPTTNLCASGTVSANPTGPGPWSWVCNGSNGGTDSPACTANVQTISATQRSRLFITSQHGSGNLGSWPQAGGKTGLAAGDQICQTLADNAALGGTWKALLSTPGNDFRDRSTHNAKGYMQIDGTVVANSWDEMFSPSCNMWQGKLNLTETGGIATDHLVVQTGTKCDGTVTTENTVQCGTDTQCSGWTSDSNWCVKGGTWVERVGLQMSGYGGGRCGYSRDGYNWSDGALYCVEQGVASSFKLSVAKLGNGTGTVTPDSGALSNNGTADYANGALVVLTASADSGSVFVGWAGGGCAGTDTCTVTLDAAKNVTANFNLQTCSYTASPDTQTFAPASATGSIAVTATPPDCAWSAVSNDSWLTVTSGSGGTGNGTVGFTVGFSTSPGPRIGSLVVGGQRVVISQQGTAQRLAYNGHEYQRVDTNQSFAQAESHCESLSGHLATITSADENAFVYNNFVKGNGPAGENNMRLGGSDAAQEGVWAWITGEAWSYSNWYPGSPDGGTSENYVFMYNSGLWADWLDTSYSTPSGTPSICEWDSATTPVNGACGTASGQSFATAPTANLCSSGTVSAIPTGTGPWSWSCNGSNGGTSSPLCSASVTQSITITTPAPASAAFNSQFTVSATASSGLPVIYSSGSTDVCINDGAIFTLVAPTGSCIVQYDQPGASGISAAPQLTSDTIALKADQTIGVISLNPATLAVGGTATVSATGGLSGNAVTFSSTTTNVCTISGSTVSGVAAGQCTIAADQAGNANYNAATQAKQSITVIATVVATEIFSENFSTTIKSPRDDGDFHQSNPFGFNALMEDANGRLHFGYMNDKTVKYAYRDRDSTAWNIASLDTSAKTSRRTSIAVVDSSNLYLLTGTWDRVSIYTEQNDATIYKISNAAKVNQVTWLTNVNGEDNGPHDTATQALGMLLNASNNLNLFGYESGWFAYGHQLYGRILDTASFTLDAEFPVSNLQGSLNGSRNIFSGGFLKANGDLSVDIADADAASVHSVVALPSNYGSWTDIGVYGALSNRYIVSSTPDALGNVHSLLTGSLSSGALNTLYYSLNHDIPEAVLALDADQDFNGINAGDIDLFVSANGDIYIAYFYHTVSTNVYSDLYLVKKPNGGSWGTPVKLTNGTGSTVVRNLHFVRSNDIARVPTAPYLAYVLFSGQRSGNVWQDKQIKIVKLAETTPITVPGATAITVTSNSTSNTSTYGDSVSFTATVSPAAATGTVGFQSDGTAIGGCGAVTLGFAGATCTTTGLGATSVGNPHLVTAVYSGDNSYASSTGSLTGGQTVNQAPLTVTATRQYDGTPRFFIFQTVTGVNGEPLTVSGTSVAFASSPNVGSYALFGMANLNLTGNGASNYQIIGGTGIITPYLINISATRQYDSSSLFNTFAGTLGAATFTVTGVVAGDVLIVGTVPGTSGATVSSPNVGSYALGSLANLNLIGIGSALASNYQIVGGTATVTPASQTITNFNAPTSINIGATGTVSATGGASGNAVTFSSTTTNVCTVSGSLVTGVAAGQCTIAANQAGDSNYLAAQMTQSFTVTLALSVSSQNVSANLATLVMQSSGSGTGYFTLLNGTSPNTVCGSSAQTAAGLDASGNPAPYYGTLLLTANTNADYTVRNLTHSTAYTACFIADSPNGQNLQPTPVSANLTTAAQASTAGDDWRAVGTAGFSAYTAKYTALAFGADGTPYAAYSDDSRGGKATVMQYSSANGWSVVGVAGFSAAQATAISLAIAPDGSPTVGYVDYGNGQRATVQRFNGSAWATVGSAGFSVGRAAYPALAFAPDGLPVLAYRDYANGGKATVMKFNGTNWNPLGSAGFTSGRADYTALAFAPGGTPYLAYSDPGNGGMATVMTFTNGSWSVVGTAGFSTGSATYLSLSIAPDGTPYLAYQDGGNGGSATVMAYRNAPAPNCNTTGVVTSPAGVSANICGGGAAWATVGQAGLTESPAFWPSLAIAADGTPYLAYADGGNGYRATVAKFAGPSWVNVGSAGFSGSEADFTALAFAPNGIPYVVYEDFSRGGKATLMRLAAQAGSAVTVTSGRNPSTYGQPVGFTATVSPPKATGTVTFMADGNAIPDCGANGTVTLGGGTAVCYTASLAAGSRSITVSYSGDYNYAPGTGSLSGWQAVNQAGQSIVFGPPPSLAIGGSGTVSATGGPSGNLVAFTSLSADVCTVSGNSVAVVTAGLCSVAANQAGNDNYSAAAQSVQSVYIAKLRQAINSIAVTPGLVVGGISTISATGGASGNPVTFSATGACTVSGSTVTGVALGKCTVYADQLGNASYKDAPQASQSVSVATGLPLTVSNANLAFGAVSSNVGGIACGKICSANFASGTAVTLTAIPVSGYQFTGWGGACRGYGNSCTVTMNAAQSVTANFAVFKIHQPVWKRMIGTIIPGG